MRKKHEESFQDNRNVLYLERDLTSTVVHICQTHRIVHYTFLHIVM